MTSTPRPCNHLVSWTEAQQEVAGAWHSTPGCPLAPCQSQATRGPPPDHTPGTAIAGPFLAGWLATCGSMEQ